MKPWPVPKLLEADRNAVTVFVTLQVLAKGKREVSTTRGRIKAVCGLSEKPISTAIKVLNEAGWITRNYGSDGRKTWFRIVLPASDLWGRYRASGRKRKEGKKRPRCVSRPGEKTTVLHRTQDGRFSTVSPPTGERTGATRQPESHSTGPGATRPRPSVQVYDDSPF